MEKKFTMNEPDIDNFVRTLDKNIEIVDEFEEYIKDALIVSQEGMEREYTI